MGQKIQPASKVKKLAETRRFWRVFALSLTKATTGYASGKKELKARGKVDRKRPPR